MSTSWLNWLGLSGGQTPNSRRITDELINTELSNYYDIYYIGAVWMGSNREEQRVVFDTSSEQFMLQVYTCSSCEGTTDYNYADETQTTFSIINSAEQEYVRVSDTAWVTGFPVRDRVCLEDRRSTCADDFNWLAIND